MVLFSFARANERLAAPMITLALLGEVMLERGVMRRLKHFPVVLPYARVRLARAAERVEKRSAKMGTVFGCSGARLVTLTLAFWNPTWTALLEPRLGAWATRTRSP